MTQPVGELDEQAASESKLDRLAAGGILGAHALHHHMSHGFYVILPELYASLGLSPIAAGALETVRRIAGGSASMVGGFVLDRFQDKRLLVLYLSMFSMGLGYALITAMPTYVVIVVAVAITGTAGSIWHPAALGLLSQAFPERRGFMVSVHRSAGSVGDFVGPLVVGAGLAIVVSWESLVQWVLPIAALATFGLWVIFRKARHWYDLQGATGGKSKERRPFSEQFAALKAMLRTRNLLLLLLVGGLNGLGQGGLLLWMGLYLRETQGMGSVGIGLHISLLTGIGIVAGPFIGILSDRIGRKPVIVGVLAIKAVLAVGLALAGSGILFAVFVALLGSVFFGVNAIVQTAALDLAHGQQLEGTMIGLLWGNNAVFSGAAPLILGFLIASFGYGVLFWFVAAVNAVAFATSLLLPSLKRPVVSASS